MINFIITLISFVLCWTASTLSVVYHYPWLGPVIIASFLVFYLPATKTNFNQFRLLLSILIIGYTVDCLENSFGLLHFYPSTLHIGRIPLWHFANWLLFASTFFTLFYWLKKNYILSALIGFIIGPLIYWTSTKLGTIELFKPLYISLLIISLVWGILMPIFIYLRHKICEI